MFVTEGHDDEDFLQVDFDDCLADESGSEKSAKGHERVAACYSRQVK